MEKPYKVGARFDNMDFTETLLQNGEYEDCIFSNCNLSNVDLSGFSFMECEFIDCNLALAKLSKTTLRDVAFKNCKLLGLQFNQCNPFLFSVRFDNSILNLSSFYGMAMKKTIFNKCSIHEVDFTDADLGASIFDNCDLTKSIFDHTNLENVNFHSSYNYSIDPSNNRIKKAKFSREGLSGLLDKYDIEIS